MENLSIISCKSIHRLDCNIVFDLDSEIILAEDIKDSFEKITQTENAFAIEVYEGEGNISINGIIHEIKSPCMIILLPNIKFRIRISNRINTKMHGLMFSGNFISDLKSLSLDMDNIISSIIDNPVVTLNDVEFRRTELYLACVKEIALNQTTQYRILSLKHLTLAFFYSVIMYLHDENVNVRSSRFHTIARKFRKLMLANYKKEHKTLFYASKLFISEKYLYTVIKAITGNTPYHWINFHIINFARSQLRTTDKPIEVISSELNFCSQSHFSNFFKRETGLSPLEFRKKKR